jgi:GNAT superfamily N-acetyltransferase
MELTFRVASGDDAIAIKACDSTVSTDPERAGIIDRWLVEDTVIVAELDAEIVGYGVFNRRFFHNAQAELVMVHPDHRGKRIGENILGKLVELADGGKFFVTTNLSNRRMQSLLIRCGFRTCGFVEELDPGDPELIFVKKPLPCP